MRTCLAVIAALVLATAGCAASPPDSDEEVTSPAPEGQGPASGDSTAAPTLDPDAVTPAPHADWQPSQPLSQPIDMTEDEKLRARAQTLADEAASFGITAPPDVALVRWISIEETAPTYVACLDAQGFPAKVTGDSSGVDLSGIPESQQEAMRLALYICRAQYTVDPRYQQLPTTEQRGIVYDYLVEFFVPCVEAAGHELSEPPSREVYTQSDFTDGDAQWIPSAELLPMPQDAWDELMRSCPPSPPSQAVWGP